MKLIIVILTSLMICSPSLANASQFQVVIEETSKDFSTVNSAILLSLKYIQVLMKSEGCQLKGYIDVETFQDDSISLSLTSIITASGGSALISGEMDCGADTSTKITGTAKVQRYYNSSAYGKFLLETSTIEKTFRFSDDGLVQVIE